MEKIVVVIGARPNIPKAWVLLRALASLSVDQGQSNAIVVHSGQHYDEHLGEGFAQQLGVPIDINLEIGSSINDACQLGSLLFNLDKTLDDLKLETVVVMGDVNTSVAAAIAASRQGLSVIHLEAGLRSRKLSPEEINRKIITACSRYHLAPSTQAANNLLAEGIEAGKIFLVGNTMAETFKKHASWRQQSNVLSRLGLTDGNYILFTVHKAYNIVKIDWIINLLLAIADVKRVVFPCHPRTHKLLQYTRQRESFGDNVLFLDALPYGDFGRLMESSYCAVTDSAGLQEECTVANVPCITIGLETARPETISHGSNNFVGYDIDRCLRILKDPVKRKQCPDYWDDNVGERIKAAISTILKDIQATKIRREVE